MRRNRKGTRAMILAFALLSFLSSLGLAKAATIHVPADQPTIQAGINAASNGDTVLVSPGTYVENINFNGKAITVTSASGPTATVIDGGGVGVVVTFDSGEGRTSTFNGFTIQNGLGTFSTGYWGGGILIKSASPTITGNVITQNIGRCWGAGIGIEQGSPLIDGNTVSNNQGFNCGGGWGGGIGVQATFSSPTLTISNNIIANNSFGVGAGIGIVYGVTPTIANNTITGNTAGAGGGIYIDQEVDVNIIQNIISNNSASSQGGGVYFSVPNGSRGPLLVNNTVANNDSPDGSAIYSTGFVSQVELINNLLIAKSGETAVDCNTQYNSAPPTILFNDTFSSGGIDFIGACAGTSGTNGNISSDPLFLNSTSNFHLQQGSPAIDAGNINAPDLPSTDFDGNPRTQNGTVDMGVYEFSLTADSVSPASLTFPDTTVGTVSQPQTVTLSNTGTNPLYFSAITSGDFAEADSCNGAVPVGTACTLNVTFSPTATGSRTGTLTLVDNTPTNPQLVSLSGTGIAPVVNLSPTSLSFPNQLIGTTSSPMTVTLTDTGDAPLNIWSVVITGDFSFTTTCGAQLATGASCTFAVSFTPTAAGMRTGALSVSDNAAGSPQQLVLSGTGYGPGAILVPSSLNFSPENVGTTSPPLLVTLTSSGDATLSISAITASGDFAENNNCPSALAPSAKCTIAVTFTPTAIGPRSGSLSVADNAGNSPQGVSLSGTGAVLTVSLSPSSLTFAPLDVGMTSQALTVSLVNTGSDTVTLYGIATTGDFTQASNCPTLIAAGTGCLISVTFSPTADGTRTGALSVTDSASGSPQTVSLSGTGLVPVASVSPTSLTFGPQDLGTTSPPQIVTLTNTGDGPLVLHGMWISPNDFGLVTCPEYLNPGSSCKIPITFSPQATGTRSGTLTLQDNSNGINNNAQIVTLTGTGINPGATLSPGSISFANQVVGTTSNPYPVTLTSTGTTNLSISSIAITGTNGGDFAQANNCPTTIAPGATCTINVTFSPSQSGPRTATLAVSDNAANSPQTVALTGTGIAPGAGISPTTLSFGNQVIGTSSAVRKVTLTSTGTTNLTISGISITGVDSGDFAQTNNCPASMVPGATCTINVTFTPAATGTRTATLAVSDNATNSPQTVALSGMGVLPVSVSPTSLNFGNQAVATTSGAKTVTLNNNLNSALVISGITTSGDFAETNTCDGSVPAKGKCTISVSFTPTATGTRTGTLTVTDNASNSPQTVSLTGTGVAQVVLSPTSLTFAAQKVGTTSGAKTVTLTNNLTTTLTITSITFTGANPGDFASPTNTCGGSLAAKATCKINVTFTPTAKGARTATTDVNDSANNSPQTVSLAGTGK
jgi:hypothetical protein